jgi:hypothetical protein
VPGHALAAAAASLPRAAAASWPGRRRGGGRLCRSRGSIAAALGRWSAAARERPRQRGRGRRLGRIRPRRQATERIWWRRACSTAEEVGGEADDRGRACQGRQRRLGAGRTPAPALRVRKAVEAGATPARGQRRGGQLRLRSPEADNGGAERRGEEAVWWPATGMWPPLGGKDEPPGGGLRWRLSLWDAGGCCGVGTENPNLVWYHVGK